MSPSRRSAGVSAALLAAAGIAGGAARHGRRARRRRRFRLRPDRPLVTELRRALEGRFAVAIAAVERGGGDARRVHDARTAVKRLRSALRLLRDTIGEPPFAALNDELRAAARALGAARDATVPVATLEALAGEAREELPGDELERLRHRLRLDADAARPGLDVEAELALSALRAACERLREWPPPDGDAAVAALASGLRRAWRRGRRAARDARSDPTDETLHTWRRRVIDMRNQAELLLDLDARTFGRARRRARRLADLLGDDHDLATLAALAADCPATLAVIAQRRRALQREAFRVGRRLHRRRPRRIARRLRHAARGRSSWPSAARS